MLDRKAVDGNSKTPRILLLMDRMHQFGQICALSVNSFVDHENAHQIWSATLFSLKNGYHAQVVPFP